MRKKVARNRAQLTLTSFFQMKHRLSITDSDSTSNFMKQSYPHRFVSLRATWLFERSKLRNSTIAQKLDFGEPLVWHMFFHHFLTLNHMVTSVFQFDWNFSK